MILVFILFFLLYVLILCFLWLWTRDASQDIFKIDTNQRISEMTEVEQAYIDGNVVNL